MAWASVDVAPASFVCSIDFSKSNATIANDLYLNITGIKNSLGANFDASALSSAHLYIGDPNSNFQAGTANLTLVSPTGTSGGVVKGSVAAATLLGAGLNALGTGSLQVVLWASDGSRTLELAKGIMQVNITP